MNFLAHIYLSGDSEDLLFGNFIGDGVKGQQIVNFSNGVQKGVQLHRFIDHFTDNHPITAEMRELIRPEFRKYAGVVLDIYFDHFLGKFWDEFHPTSLPDFASKIHLQLDHFEPQMPKKTQYFFKYMKMYNWLVNYRELDALNQIFKGMANRTTFDSNMEQAVPVLLQNRAEIEAAFRQFFPELEDATKGFIRSIPEIK